MKQKLENVMKNSRSGRDISEEANFSLINGGGRILNTMEVQ
jgi:hypothetical protein